MAKKSEAKTMADVSATDGRSKALGLAFESI
jgi:hypothetical protein